MLASTGEATPKESSFFKRFIKNGSSIPSSISQTTENSLLLKPKKTINNLSSRLYQIVFDSINGIPVPNVVLQKASKLNANIGCKLSMSLFDLESAAFVGQTWISPYVIPVIKNIKKEEQNDSDSDVQTGDELTSPGLESLRAHLIGNKLNLKMKRQCVYFHTLLQSKHILSAFEVSFSVTEAGVVDPEVYSGGWSPLYLFNTKRGGIDISGNVDAGVQDKSENVKVAPLFSGSPRLLPVVAASMFEAASGFPGLAQLGGSSLQYYILQRPDIKPKSFLWKPNTFVSPGDTIPGIEKISVRGIQLNYSERITLGNIKVNVPSALSEFEEKMLELVRDSHYEEFPESISMDSEGNVSIPRIIERRVLLGYHNSFDWIQPPTSITLQPNMDDDGKNSELNFSGNVRLQNYSNNDISLVFSVEYKVSLAVKGPMPEEKAGLAKLVDRLSNGSSPKNATGVFEIEKIVVAGWGLIDIGRETSEKGGEKTVSLQSGSAPNPFSSLVYKSYIAETKDKPEDNTSSLPKMALAPIELSFSILDAEDAVTGTRPYFEKVGIESQTPATATMPTPVLPETPAPILKKTEGLADEREIPEVISEVKSIKNEDFSPLPPLPITPRRSELSRGEKARLLQSGYETYRDENGRFPENVEPSSSSTVKSNINLEIEDVRSDEVIVQMVGITLNDDFRERSGGATPDSVSFSFRFYTFPDMSTERCKLYTGSLPPNYQRSPGFNNHKSTSSLKNEDEIWPAILYKIDQDGRPAYDRPSGISIQFNVDSHTRKSCANIRYGATSFPYYMDQKQLYIDVWDGSSLLHLGTACVDLKMGLRQGRPAVTVDHEVDIMWHEYADDDFSHMRRSSSASTSSRPIASDTRVRSTKLGTLFLKLHNIGRTKSVGESPKMIQMGSDGVVVEDFHSQAKFRANSAHQLKRMPDADSELRALLQTMYEERVESKKAAMDKVDPTEPLTEDGKKLQNVYRAMKKDKVDAPFSWDISDYIKSGPESFMYKQSRQERQKDLETVEIYRERHKQKAVQNALREQLTTRHTIDASFGQGYFFEYILENPYSIDQVFEVSWGDPDLRIVEGQQEWTYHRRCNNLVNGIEMHNFGNLGNGRAEIFMKRREKISVPFVFQNFSSSVSELHSSSGINNSVQVQQGNAKPTVRVVPVSFLNSKKCPIAFLELIVNPMHFYLDRSIQMFHCENELVRKSIRYPVSSGSLMLLGPNDNGLLNIQASPTNEKYLKCSNQDVVCSINSHSSESKYREISFKYRVGAAPDHSDIYFIFFHDPHCANVHEIWKVSLHTIFRLDVNCIYGQTNIASLVLRGRTMTRQIMCYLNLPGIVNVANEGPVTLPANSLTEIPLNIRLDGPEDNHVIANIIDIETRSLISSWYIITHLTMPAITKVFNIKLTKGKASNKRVSYTNPFIHKKTLVLKTDSPHLMQFKNNTMDLNGGETQYIGLKFAPCFNIPRAEILVFLNNEMDKVEECLSIEVIYEHEL